MIKSPCYANLHSIDSSIPSKHFANIIERLPCHHSSLLFQLRSGHAPLNKHLHRIVKTASATCSQCEEGNESVHHFLFSCPAYTRQHDILHRELGTKAHHMKHVLNDPDCLKSLFKYITSTKRFEKVFGDVSPPKDKNKQKM
ncbi:hypothetical protein BDR05DRAFT_890617 [Suillus weaverae]|nr:hypothetical protein BDR05DRAFT_890617 [Suillus weaverae]